MNSYTTDAVVVDLIPQNQTDQHSRGRHGNRDVYKRRAPDIGKLPVVHTTTDYTNPLFSPMAYSKLAEKDMKNETKRAVRKAQVPRIIMLTIQAVLFVVFFPFLLFFSMWQAMRSRGAPTVTRCTQVCKFVLLKLVKTARRASAFALKTCTHTRPEDVALPRTSSVPPRANSSMHASSRAEQVISNHIIITIEKEQWMQWSSHMAMEMSEDGSRLAHC